MMTFEVGDEVLHEDFERCGAGTGIVEKVLKSDLPLKYHVLCKINHQKLGERVWWFPLSKISHVEQPYDPLQNGDTEEDI